MSLPEPRLDLEGATAAGTARSAMMTEMAPAIVRTTLVVMVVIALLLRGPAFEWLSPVYLTTLLAGIYNVGLLVMYWRGWFFPGHRHFILILDVVFVTLWIGLGGPTGLTFFPIYYALAVVAGLWFGTVGAVTVAAVSSLLYVAVLFATQTGAPDAITEAVRERIPFLLIIALLGGYIADAQARERAIFERAQLALAAYGQHRRLMQDFYDLLNPAALISPPGLDVGVAFRPALRMGAGDYYDLLQLEQGVYGLCVADVAGKYGAEVLRVPVVKYALKVAASAQRDPGEVIALVNSLVFDELQPDRFVTMFYARVDTRNGEVRYVGAGHPFALLVRGDQSVDSLEQGGLVLGVMRDARYDEGVARWGEGDALVLYTDGAIEATDARGEELGHERLREIARNALATAADASAAAAAMLAAIEQYAKDSQRRDDLTLLVARPERVTAAPSPPKPSA